MKTNYWVNPLLVFLLTALCQTVALGQGVQEETLRADRHGKPIPADKGPFRIIVPGEKKHARWTWGVTSFLVRSAKD